MNKRLFLTFLAIFAVLSNIFAQGGVVKENYSWEFPLFEYLPEYWSHIEDGSVNYEIVNSEWVDGWYNKALKVGAQGENKDYLVSLPLKGEVSFFVKKNSDGSASSVKLFAADKSGSSYKVSNEISTDFDATSLSGSDYIKVTAKLSDYQSIAFRFDNVYVACLKADYAEMPGKRSIVLNSVNFSDGYKNPFTADSENKVTIKATLNVKNDGDVTLDGNDPEYYGMLAITKEEGWNNFVPDEEQRAIGKLPTLQPGESGDAEIELTFVCPDGTPNSSGIISVRVDGYTYLDGTLSNKQIGGYTNVQVKPYKPIMVITYNNSTYNPGTESSPRYIEYGIFSGEKSQSVTLKNNGIAPLVINSGSLPDGVELTTIKDFPFTIETGETITETITLNGEKAIEGAVKFGFDGLGTNVIYVKGFAIPENLAFYDFEDGQLPSLWYKTDNGAGTWEIYNNPVTDASNKKCLRHSNSSYPSSVTTGRLHFDEGDNLNFSVALRSTSSRSLSISISKDRKDWKEVAKLGSAGLSFPTTTSKWQEYSIAIPEGDWYVKFNGAYIYLDNVYGGVEAPLDPDVMTVAASVGSKTMVNYPLSLSTTFRNFGQDLTDYIVKMTVDGEEVVSTMSDMFESGSEKQFTLSYYPHSSGEKEIAVVLSTASDEEIESQSLIVEVAEESLEQEIKIGDFKGSGENIPLYLYYKNSKSEYIYTADKIANGKCKITKIAYDFYSTENDPKITKTRIWLQNTSEAEVGTDFTPINDMTLVYEYAGNPSWQKGSASNYQKMEFELDEHFDYEGGNLRLVIESNATSYAHTYFSCDDSDTNILYFKSDTETTGAATALKKMPVTYFTVTKEAVEVMGKVTVAENPETRAFALEPITVTAVAKDSDVLYSTEVDADGSYTLPILQADKDYTISATHPDYGESDAQDVDFGNPIHNFVFSGNTSVLPEIFGSDLKDSDCVIYNLNGIRVDNPSEGVYIRVRGNKAEKVVIRK